MSGQDFNQQPSRRRVHGQEFSLTVTQKASVWSRSRCAVYSSFLKAPSTAQAQLQQDLVGSPRWPGGCGSVGLVARCEDGERMLRHAWERVDRHIPTQLSQRFVCTRVQSRCKAAVGLRSWDPSSAPRSNITLNRMVPYSCFTRFKRSGALLPDRAL